MAKKKADRPSAPKVEKPSKTGDSTAIVPFVGDEAQVPSSAIAVQHPDVA